VLHFFIQSVKPKPIIIVTHSHLFSCTFQQLHVITSRFDWFVVWYVSFVIGYSDYFGFGFNTLSWKPLKSINNNTNHEWQTNTSSGCQALEKVCHQDAMGGLHSIIAIGWIETNFETNHSVLKENQVKFDTLMKTVFKVANLSYRLSLMFFLWIRGPWLGSLCMG